MRWSRLPGSRLQGDAVRELLGGRLVTDVAARTGVIGDSKAPRVLHVASHGAFLPRPSQVAEIARGNRLEALEGKVSGSVDPMLRGVVILAGANRVAGDRQDDGLLSALELSRIDLKGTELVTLSACDTGTGMIEVGDGVYGLRRGIAVAGARSSLLSLWKVNDQATNVLMQQFYGQLRRGRTPEQALHYAQTFMRQHANKRWHNPFFWAAFQLYGRSW
jgi:CHAT domain-containing protein